MFDRPAATFAAVLLGILFGIPAGQFAARHHQASLEKTQAELDNAERRAGLYYAVNQDLLRQLTAAEMAAEQTRADCRARLQAAALSAATRRDPMAGVVLEPAGE